MDEISNEVLPLLAALDLARLNGTRIITFGDFDQLPPIANSWRGAPVAEDVFRWSRLYKLWSDCTMFKLTQPRRCDPKHFQFYTTLPSDLRGAVAQARARHPPNAEADYNLVLSNGRRKAISSRRQRDAALDKETVQVPSGDDPEYPLFVGTRLIGCLTIKGVVNGAFYTVTAIKRPGFRCILRDDLTGAVWEGTPEDLSKCTQLRHADHLQQGPGAEPERLCGALGPDQSTLYEEAPLRWAEQSEAQESTRHADTLTHRIPGVLDTLKLCECVRQ